MNEMKNTGCLVNISRPSFPQNGCVFVNACVIEMKPAPNRSLPKIATLDELSDKEI
jgi:hypothetical protein